MSGPMKTVAVIAGNKKIFDHYVITKCDGADVFAVYGSGVAIIDGLRYKYITNVRDIRALNLESLVALQGHTQNKDWSEIYATARARHPDLTVKYE